MTRLSKLLKYRTEELFAEFTSRIKSSTIYKIIQMIESRTALKVAKQDGKYSPSTNYFYKLADHGLPTNYFLHFSQFFSKLSCKLFLLALLQTR